MPFCEERVRSDLVFSFRPVALSLIDQSSSQITEEVFTSLRQRPPCQTRSEYLSQKNWECLFWILGFWNCLLGCLSDFLRTVYQILFTLSNDENKYHHWWFTNLKTLKKTRKSGHICASLTYITWISCDSCIICITCTKEISHQLILWDIIHITGILTTKISHQLTSWDIIDYHWLSLIIIGYHWLSLVIIDNHWSYENPKKG